VKLQVELPQKPGIEHHRYDGLIPHGSLFGFCPQLRILCIWSFGGLYQAHIHHGFRRMEEGATRSRRPVERLCTSLIPSPVSCITILHNFCKPPSQASYEPGIEILDTETSLLELVGPHEPSLQDSFPRRLLQATVMHQKKYHMSECQGPHPLRKRRVELVLNFRGGEPATSTYDWSVAAQIRTCLKAGPCPVARLPA
jgi:hypothetical protein